MSKMKVVAALLAVGVTMPIWLFLIYQIMVRVQATELMWFLFWIYVPVSIVAGVLAKFVEGEK